MHRLRTSVLLRRSERILIAGLLLAAQAAFLWMFFASDPLEQLSAGDPALRRFASDWRHGTAGNAWLYMPGFFATAAAVWLAAEPAGRRTAARRLAVSGGVAAVAAILASPSGARLAATDFQRITGHAIGMALPPLAAAGVLRGLYTLTTWTVFVLACRSALAGRTWRPFAAPALLAVGLALIRPWTLGDVGGVWTERAAAGDAVAWVSALSLLVMAALLVGSVQCNHRRTKPTCPTASRRATTTNIT